MEGKNKVMMIVIIALLIVLIGAVVGLTIFSMQAMKKDTETETNKPVVEKVVQLTQDDLETITFSKTIVTNLRKGTDGLDHQIRIALAIGVNKIEKTSAAMIENLKTKDAIMQAVALEVIHTKTMQELDRPDGRDILKNDILIKLQEEFNTNMIAEVYIVESLWY